MKSALTLASSQLSHLYRRRTSCEAVSLCSLGNGAGKQLKLSMRSFATTPSTQHPDESQTRTADPDLETPDAADDPSVQQRDKPPMFRMKRPNLLNTPAPPRRELTIGEQLQEAGEDVASSCWILVENISPISSLHNMLAGIEDALISQQEGRGILDLDMPWSDSQVVGSEDEPSVPPLLHLSQGGIRSLVRKAIVVLSPFGRPTGWKIQFTSRSFVQALLLQQAEDPIVCAWKQVRISEWHDDNEQETMPQITDSTLRLEGFSHHLSPLVLMNLFTRFDLDETRPKSIEQWQEKTSDGKSSNSTWLVHFADASWARAALREKQSIVIKEKTIVLSPYPEQIL